MRPAAALAERLGLPVADVALLEQALVHSSWLHEHPDEALGHNERLEFLGDAVINLAISEALYAAHPDDDEGLLSARRATIVSTTGLSRIAGRIELGAALMLGEGEAQRGGRRRPSLLASGFEALAGALFLTIGWERTRDWLTELTAAEIAADTAGVTLKSPKSRLQEYTQRRSGTRPEYRVLDAVGPDHEKVFRVEVAIEGRPIGLGEGPSRRVAETAAATRALDRIRREAAAERPEGSRTRRSPRPAAAPDAEGRPVASADR